MIINNTESSSQIAFSVVVLIALIIYEFGGEKIKKKMSPFIIILITLFLIMVVIKIYSMI